MNDRRPDEIAPDEAWQPTAPPSRIWAFPSRLPGGHHDHDL
jgi:hypothetical protein